MSPFDSRPVGDSNNDGIFNSNDLVVVFRAGEYEDGITGNSTFDEGDWSQDGDFDSRDLVLVFQAGTYEVTPRNLEFDIAAAIDQVFARDQDEDKVMPRYLM